MCARKRTCLTVLSLMLLAPSATGRTFSHLKVSDNDILASVPAASSSGSFKCFDASEKPAIERAWFGLKELGTEFSKCSDVSEDAASGWMDVTEKMRYGPLYAPRHSRSGWMSGLRRCLPRSGPGFDPWSRPDQG